MADSERIKGFEQMLAMGWTIARTTGKGYTLFHCPCGSHQIQFTKTPSNPNHYRNRVNRASVICPETPPEPETEDGSKETPEHDR